MKRVLAFDYGASSGRAILFSYDGQRLDAEELYRFENIPVKGADGILRWNYALLKNALFEGLAAAAKKGPIDAIGIDTWGVDIGLLDEDGKLIEDPVHYRDNSVESMPSEVFSIVPRDRLYALTGIQVLSFNTLFRLLHLMRRRPEIYARVDKFLFMPDLLVYELTGQKVAERTIASTSQLTDARTKNWSEELISTLGFRRSMFPDIVDSGSKVGVLKAEIAARFGLGSVPVIAVCEHDTASAVFSVPAVGGPLYLSCGTWSLLGTVLEKPCLDAASAEADFTNETGYGGITRYLKNIMGLWIINECRRSFRKTREIGFSEIVAEAQKVENKFRIDVDDPAFLAPDDMPTAIRDYCLARYGAAPVTIGEIAACVYDSLCMRYRETIALIERLTGKRFDALYVVGGGCNAEALMQAIADTCGLTVSAGPVEATAIGNALVQLIALGEVQNDDRLKALIRDSFPVATYRPSHR